MPTPSTIHVHSDADIDAAIADAIADLGLDAVFNGITQFGINGLGTEGYMVKDGITYSFPVTVVP